MNSVQKNIKVSVIIPVYNVEAYLEECLVSIMNQTLKEIEIICIDDKSSDKSYEMLKHFSREDPRIVLMQNPRNLGAACTRNIGIQVAEGKYMAILDSDDIYEENFLEVMYISAEKNSADVCICGYSLLEENGRKTEVYQEYDDNIKKQLVQGFSVKTLPDDIFLVGNIGPTTKIFNREYIVSNQILFQDLRNSNDVYFGVIAFARAKKIIYISECLVYYRKSHPGNITNNSRKKYPYCGYEAWLKSYQKLQELGLMKVCKKSFFERVTISVMYTLKYLDNRTEKKRYTEFWKNIGFHQIGMSCCDRKDFKTMTRYSFYKKIMGNVPDKNQCGTSVSDDIGREMIWNAIAFPYHVFPREARILVIGSEMSADLYNQINKFRNHINFVGIVYDDMDAYQRSLALNNIERYSLKSMKGAMFDYILIVESEKSVARCIKDKILSIGVDESRIVWIGSICSIYEWLKGYYFKMLEKTEEFFPF